MNRLRTHYLESVWEFHSVMDLPIAAKPQCINQRLFALRVRLIMEELSEYCGAVAADDIVEIGDALGDLLYVTFGLCIVHGLPMNKIFKQIHESNMTKVDGYMDRSGKLIKPDNYKAVDLSWLKEE